MLPRLAVTALAAAALSGCLEVQRLRQTRIVVRNESGAAIEDVEIRISPEEHSRGEIDGQAHTFGRMANKEDRDVKIRPGVFREITIRWRDSSGTKYRWTGGSWEESILRAEYVIRPGGRVDVNYDERRAIYD